MIGLGRVIKYLLLIAIVVFTVVDNTKIMEFVFGAIFTTLSAIGSGFFQTVLPDNPNINTGVENTTDILVNVPAIDIELTATEKIVRSLVGKY